ncbi:23S rRNA (pseudouridine(1915)-N(3))-methyltransferase RlmH [Oceaniglobus indicus]|uniref:23S rRNA (pseudouridine(1915)-N(3))-methyltransferase RlmH n=1 Tax=Oceaniglobus indicus TaxID=2047749 RepID=UPI000C191663|nr:23S rRNA (pseudouridine(1915)-N(3))-methyltransferase RlmH [Oceaniglobus indicus]
MRLHIAAVGRLRAGPEKALCDDYLARLDKSGRALSLSFGTLSEVEDKKGAGKAGEAALLRRAIPAGALVCAMDERGRTLSSPQFADHLASWRDQGRQDVAFVIGGADGLDADLRDAADFRLSFGAMVWPHMLVRVMLSEQLYRATSILAGAPYHRA